MSTRADILDEAKRTVTRDRNDTYGEPDYCHSRLKLLEKSGAEWCCKHRSAPNHSPINGGSRMAVKPLPSQDTLRQLFRYDPETGGLFWRETLSQRAPAGSRAGTFHKPTGYRKVSVGKSIYREHRIIWRMHYGETPDEIDHANGDRSDNRLENLRPASRAENNQNRAKQSNNSSGFTGVSFCKERGAWEAHIKINGKKKHLGRHPTKEGASEAYARAKLALHRFHSDVVLREAEIRHG